MSSLVSWSDPQCAELSTALPPAPSEAGGGGAVDNSYAKSAEFNGCWFGLFALTASKKSSRSAFSDTAHSWQVSVGEGGTCARGLRIFRPQRLTFTGLASSPRVRLRSTTNTQGSPSYRLTIFLSQNANTHVTNIQFSTFGGAT
jgi:hypothetical protein